MFTLKPSSLLMFGILAALCGPSLSARADEFVQNLGPVGPHEPILTQVGDKRLIAFYELESGKCGMHVIVWQTDDVVGGTGTRVRVTLNPREMVQIDTPDNKSVKLQCGNYAETLALVRTDSLVTARSAQ
jgi:hypothetical protein